MGQNASRWAACGAFLPSGGLSCACVACCSGWMFIPLCQDKSRASCSPLSPFSAPLCLNARGLLTLTSGLSQACTANRLDKWTRVTWWLSRRPNTKLVLKSTISARRISCWMDPRRSPACRMAAGAPRRHFAEVKGPSQQAAVAPPRGSALTAFFSFAPFGLRGTSVPTAILAARCLIPAERSRVVIAGVKRWPFDVTDAMVPHGENVTFYCKHPQKQCSFGATQTCFDGKLQPPACYLG